VLDAQVRCLAENTICPTVRRTITEAQKLTASQHNLPQESKKKQKSKEEEFKIKERQNCHP